MRYFTSFSIKIFVTILVSVIVNVGEASEGFPGRAKYKDVPIYELKELHEKLDRVVVVDTRSPFEYETLRIKGAINIPVSNKSFESQVLKMSKTIAKPIVFYCNGHTCMKSYIAVKKSQAIAVENTYAYDAGIFDWSRAYPHDAVLLGQSPVDSKHLIATKHLKSKMLDPDTFADKVSRLGQNSVVIDIRDKYQRAGIGFFPAKERWISLNKMDKLHIYIKNAKRNNKTIFIYDEVGKQVRWLQYALEKANVKNYYFMDNGAKGYYDLMAQLEWPSELK